MLPLHVFFRTILKREGYCCLSVWLHIHLSSQKCIWLPSFNWNDPKVSKESFTFMRPAQNWESPGFFWTWAIVSFFKYFFLNKLCQIPSSLMSLNNHLLNKHLFCISRFLMPNPPISLGWHKIFHLANLYFFFMFFRLPKESWTVVVQSFKYLFRDLKKRIT